MSDAYETFTCACLWCSEEYTATVKDNRYPAEREYVEAFEKKVNAPKGSFSRLCDVCFLKVIDLGEKVSVE